MMLRHLTRLLAAALVTGAVIAPAAGAQPARDVTQGSGTAAVSAVSPPPPRGVATPVTSDSSGFDWGSAAIGAGAAVLVALAAGGVATTRHRVHPTH
jgi:hypothetical protein